MQRSTSTSEPSGSASAKAAPDLGLACQVQAHATSVVAVAGLDHDRQAEILGDLPGFVGVLATARPWGTGTPTAASNSLVRSLSEAMPSAMALVRSVSAVQMRRLPRAVAELHQVAVVQADVRNAAVGGGGHDGGGAGAEVAVVDDVAQPGHGGLHVEAGIVDGGHQQRMPFLQRGARHLLVAGPEHHAVDARLAGASASGRSRSACRPD
jgi:hypothetical protein